MTHQLYSKVVFLLLFVFFRTLVVAQAPVIEWQKSFGGTSGEPAECVKQTADGGFIISGYTHSIDGDVVGNHGGYDYWIIKLSVTGTLEWKKTYGGTGDEYARSIHQTNDGGYIVSGYSNSNNGDVTGGHGDNDYWILKLSAIGNIEWKKTLGGLSHDAAECVKQTDDGGFIITGYTLSNNGDVTGNHGGVDWWIVKLSAVGIMQWQKCFGGTSSDQAECIKQTGDGGFIISGFTHSNNGDVTGNHGGSDYWVVKISANGLLEWQKAIGGTYNDYAYDIQQTLDGGYIVAGYTNSNNGDVTGNHGGNDYWIVKLSNIGIIEWQKTLGGTSDDYGLNIQQTSEGGYIVGGYSNSTNGDVIGNHGGDDYWIVKLNVLGAIEWQKTLGGSAADNLRSIQQSNDGGYIVSGQSRSSNGDVTLNKGQSDFWIVKLAPSSLNNSNFERIDFEVYPNPTNSIVTLRSNSVINEVVVFDSLGKKVLETIINSEEGKIDLSSLHSGLYLLKVLSNDSTSFRKVIKK